jgi:hypothetical protein
MPNWCECDWYVEGARERIEAFLALAKGEERSLDFGRFIPYPEEFAARDRAAALWHELPPERRPDECPTDGYNSGGYEWCIVHWGTKWQPARTTIGGIETVWDGLARLAISFETAWSPPLPIVERAAQLFADLAFDLRYFEGGMGFHGQFRCEEGEVVRDETADYYGCRGG